MQPLDIDRKDPCGSALIRNRRSKLRTYAIAWHRPEQRKSERSFHAAFLKMFNRHVSSQRWMRLLWVASWSEIRSWLHRNGFDAACEPHLLYCDPQEWFSGVPRGKKSLLEGKLGLKRFLSLLPIYKKENLHLWAVVVMRDLQMLKYLCELCIRMF